MLLFTPGPTPVLENVRAAMAKETIHHRTPEFTEIFKSTRELLFNLLKTDEVLMFASTGTGAMEACVTNLCHKKALTINAGKFGERFSKICSAFNIPFKELTYEWDTPADVGEVVEAVKNDSSIDALFVQICESSGGLRHPIEDIAREVKAIRPEIMIVADGITAVGVEPIDVTNIDALITGSQKALMLPPGLSIVGLSSRAIEKIGKGKGFYFNMASELKKQREGTTAYTAATTLIIGLKEMLNNIFELGLDTLYDLTDRRATATRVALEAIGLKIYPKKPANAMTAVIDEDAEKIRKILKSKYEVNIAGGQEHLKGKLFRINHMGIIKAYEAAWVVNAIELAMSELGRIEYTGKANKIFNELYFGE
ncbi:pyridoxal-phosphate-dependent aminotransferase family protein [Nitrosophilus kaiyonis]|uniref:pyridoxal-phosphate-dependent aminotransferase family protein n=1 Tax=Nitrosophilus kaiyonis TaxID=2930200 RepID=UPI002493BA67|nr:alanine--glyoxylate aminotransferase family protein [Nitrosophilus kaiyonis]